MLTRKEERCAASDWSTVRLGDCIQINDSTYTPSEAWPFINYLDTGNITENRIAEIQHLIAGEDKIPSRARRKVEPGDIVYSTVRPNQRHFGLIKTVPENFLASTGFSVMRGKNDIACTDFIYWFLAQDCVVERLHTIAEHSTSAYPSIRPTDFKQLTLDLPSLPEQRAIAHILSTLDDKIELNRRMNETLEAMARAIFKDWFIDFGPTRAKAEGSVPYLPPEIWNLFPDQLVDSELGEIPKGWELRKLDGLVSLTKGQSYKSSELRNSTVALVTLKSFKRGGGYRQDGLKPYTGKYKPEQIVAPGELVMALTDVTQAADVVGKPAIILEDIRFSTLVASLDVGIIRTKHEYTGRAFIYHLLQTERFQNHAYSNCTGTTVLHLSKDVLTSFVACIPPRELMIYFDQTIDPVAIRIAANARESVALTQTRDLLLPKLMSGKVRVAREKG